MSIVRQLFEIIQDIGEENSLEEITRVTVSIGGMRQVIPESFQFAFDTLKKNSLAESAELVMELVPIKIRCERCGNEAIVTDHVFYCPSCGAGDVNIIEGDEIVIKNIEGSR